MGAGISVGFAVAAWAKVRADVGRAEAASAKAGEIWRGAALSWVEFATGGKAGEERGEEGKQGGVQRTRHMEAPVEYLWRLGPKDTGK